MKTIHYHDIPPILITTISKQNLRDIRLTSPVSKAHLAKLEIPEVFDWANFTQQVEWLWVIPTALLAIIVYDITDIIKGTRAMARSIGKKATTIRQLKILAFVLIYFEILVLAFDIQGLGKPIFWLASALISLTIALFLDDTFKK